MKKHWIKDLTEKQVIHAPTKMIAERLCKKFNTLGLKWSSGTPYSKRSLWGTYREEACYRPSKGEYCSLNYYIQEGYEILTIEQLLDFQEEDKTFPRWMMVGTNENEIDNKMFVLCRLPDGADRPYVVIFKSDVENYKNGRSYRAAMYKYAKEIDEPVEMTLEQVCKELGREIKIIK